MKETFVKRFLILKNIYFIIDLESLIENISPYLKNKNVQIIDNFHA